MEVRKRWVSGKWPLMIHTGLNGRVTASIVMNAVMIGLLIRSVSTLARAPVLWNITRDATVWGQ